MEQILSQSSDPLSTTEEEKRIFDKTLTYYNACLNDKMINDRGFMPIIPYAKNVLNYAKTQDLPSLWASLSSIGVHMLFKTVYTKVEFGDSKDLRLQFLPAIAYPVPAETVARTLKPFVDTGVFKPSNGLDQIAQWIAKLEELNAAFVQAHK
jgi:hypothetical protein